MSNSPLAHRVSLVAESITLAVSAKAAALRKAGVDVVGFGAGEPDFDTPEFIKDACIASLKKGQTKYTPTPCHPELKEAISRKFKRENGLDYAPNQVTTGAGGKFCLYLAFQALVNPGDEVILPAPYWVSYPEQVKLCGGVNVEIKGSESHGFKITPEQLEKAITPKTKVFIINSPSNPAGHAYTPAELKALADVLGKHPHVWVFSDEIYEKLVYGGLKSVSFATLHPDLMRRTITFNCHSKSFSMTGWRVGYAGGPKDVIDAMNKLQGQMTSHITSFVQVPSATALDDPRGAESIEAMRKEFEVRGVRMWELLTSIPGVTCVKPQGAFYCFPNVGAYLGRKAGGVPLTGAVSFAAALLEQAHVAVVPGTDCGFDTHVRLSFATSMENIEKGVHRIVDWLRKVE